MSRVICLVSGGLDSATVAAMAMQDGSDVIALTLNYGQLHAKEIESAKKIAQHLKIKKHYLQEISLPWKGSALIDDSITLPVCRDESKMNSEIPASYVPARNTIFLSLATSCAEAEGACAIFIGANAIDYSGYPDCRPEYLSQFERMIQLGTKCGIEGQIIKIEAPLLHMSKAEIIRTGSKLKVPYELTWSCYRGGEVPCGICDSCILRAKGFYEAGIPDPVLIQSQSGVCR